MNKLIIVREALDSSNTAIVIADQERVFDLNVNCIRAQTVNIFVAPSRGLYTADALQSFMIGLVMPIEPTCKVDFQGGCHGLSFGRLYFDEVIGTEVVAGSRTVSVTDLEVKLPDSFENGKVVIDLDNTIELQRRTWVRVYPDYACARRAVDGVDMYWTSNLAVPTL